ncbi:flagellar biosynthetic protein FliO [Aliidiomarina iranensis]|uniref:Flagellar protein n=1 Tax=Aliidiomarina iranensis TaxID=1434071 RepID=A0A432W1U0_9GAMM|nr:flagellar biosynthetic protein FliO [Aliidiomarina iranensis]RUO23200.1 flagellar biosynthetic protein FliO [Aliidiomarina iranensis]
MNSTTTSTASTPAGTDVVSSLTLLGKVSASLIMVIVIILVCAWIFRRMGGNWLPSSTHKIHVVTSASLGGKERVVVVDVEDKRLVLGVGPGSVNRLSEGPIPVAKESDAASNTEQDSTASPLVSSFAKLLKAKQNAVGSRQSNSDNGPKGGHK